MSLAAHFKWSVPKTLAINKVEVLLLLLLCYVFIRFVVIARVSQEPLMWWTNTQEGGLGVVCCLKTATARVLHLSYRTT